MDSDRKSIPSEKKDEPEAFRPEPPDITHLVTEDDEPVDNLYAERLMRLLVEPLYASWEPGREFVAMANVGLYASAKDQPIVPDMMLSMGVKAPSGEGVLMEKKNRRCYLVWEYGKRPDVVIEIVSPTKGGELGRKLKEYARIGVSFYVVYDPLNVESEDRLKEFVLIGQEYEPMQPVESYKGIGLRLAEWNGEFEGSNERWLRWTYPDGKPVPTGAEKAQSATQRARERSRNLTMPLCSDLLIFQAS
jgi:Uma2 family endonuclease